jgi:hypothetical protein
MEFWTGEIQEDKHEGSIIRVFIPLCRQLRRCAKRPTHLMASKPVFENARGWKLGRLIDTRNRFAPSPKQTSPLGINGPNTLVIHWSLSSLNEPNTSTCLCNHWPNASHPTYEAFPSLVYPLPSFRLGVLMLRCCGDIHIKDMHWRRINPLYHTSIQRYCHTDYVLTIPKHSQTRVVGPFYFGV